MVADDFSTHPDEADETIDPGNSGTGPVTPPQAADAATVMAPAAGSREQSGRQIGRYKLLEMIGEGGFGSVWMAEQREPVRRRVALKIIKLGMDTKQVIARFEAERQALAMMDHPNIAKVFDAGTTETGRPYFVMEYIKGIPILEYCDTEKLDTQQRLDLFVLVCHAIQHAHQKGIIHRDIKPTNVLITIHDGTPVPKVIDFGIAKATNTELTSKTLFTEHRQLIGTPAYMSPEQFKGLKLDARSDVYQLGVLAYRLLTGQVPFAHNNFFKLGMLHTTKLPTRPSKLCEAVPGELEELVMRCLEKRPRMRYENAGELEKDLARFLEPFESGLLRRGQVEERMTAAAALSAPPHPPLASTGDEADQRGPVPPPAPPDEEPLDPFESASDELGLSQSTGERMAAVALGWSDRFQAMLPESSADDPALAGFRHELALALVALGFGGALALHAASAAPGPGVALALCLWPVARGLTALFVDAWAPGWLRTLGGLAALNAASLVIPVLAGTALLEVVAREGRPAVSGGLAWLVPLRAPYTSARGLLLPCLGLGLLYASIRSLGREEGARSLRELCEAAACGAGVLALSRAAMVAGGGTLPGL